VSCVKFSPNGKTVLGCTMDNKIRLWELREGALYQDIRGPPQHTGLPRGSLLHHGGHVCGVWLGGPCHLPVGPDTKKDSCKHSSFMQQACGDACHSCSACPRGAGGGTCIARVDQGQLRVQGRWVHLQSWVVQGQPRVQGVQGGYTCGAWQVPSQGCRMLGG
jgi:hypothetical protein